MKEDFNHAAAPLETIYGTGILHCFTFGDHEEDNILVVAAGDYLGSALVRVQSACYTGEIFRSADCDCHEQLDRSLKLIHDRGGLFVYMIADGRGAGLLTKTRGLDLSAREGLDTYQAYEALGVEADPREYGRVAAVLRDLGLEKLELLTNNPRKIEGLKAAGFTVQRVPIEIAPTQRSEAYLRAKQRSGHLLTFDQVS
jgi:GTP cyclohydrolase II